MYNTIFILKFLAVINSKSPIILAENQATIIKKMNYVIFVLIDLIIIMATLIFYKILTISS